MHKQAESKVAPGPDSWLAGGDPTPVVMQQTDTRHGSALLTTTVPESRTEMQGDCENFLNPGSESPAERKIRQRDSALVRANMVRLGRATIKRQIASGELKAADIIRDAPWLLAGMPAFELVLAVHRVGRGRARKIIDGICSETLQLGNMGPTTRNELARRVRTVEEA